MERLTKRIGDRVFISDERHPDIVNMAYEKLAAYEDAEEQGLLVKLPCKCQEVVWTAEKGFKTHKAFYASPSAMLDDIEHGFGIGYTMEEAEAALERMNENA